MDIVLYYIRDNLVGTHYFIYAFILFFLMFSIIGYLFKQKYGKLDIKLATSQSKNQKDKEEKIKDKNDKSLKKIKNNKVEVQTKTDPIKTNVVTNVNQNTLSSNINNVTPSNPELVKKIETPINVNLAQPQVSSTNIIVNPTPQPNTKPLETPTPIPMPNTKPSKPTIPEPIKTEIPKTPTMSPIPEIKL